MVLFLELVTYGEIPGTDDFWTFEVPSPFKSSNSGFSNHRLFSSE